jgi:tripartite-type tricarboxylate transporter receptor subunit TctC
MPSVRSLIVGCFAMLLASLTNHHAWSQATRPIKFVVPLKPGSAFDIVARLLAEQMDRAQARTVIVENRPGAGSSTPSC